jgi:hypothetical protein
MLSALDNKVISRIPFNHDHSPTPATKSLGKEITFTPQATNNNMIFKKVHAKQLKLFPEDNCTHLQDRINSHERS